jgi:hypothetical protein
VRGGAVAETRARARLGRAKRFRSCATPRDVDAGRDACGERAGACVGGVTGGGMPSTRRHVDDHASELQNRGVVRVLSMKSIVHRSVERQESNSLHAVSQDFSFKPFGAMREGIFSAKIPS